MRRLATLAILAILPIISVATPAYASSQGCTDGRIDGLAGDFKVCFRIDGKGARVDQFTVWATGDVDFGIDKTPPGFDIDPSFDVPTLKGCEVHANVRNSEQNVNYDTPAVACSELTRNVGPALYDDTAPQVSSNLHFFEIPVGRDVDKGKYCGTLWFKLNDYYLSGGTACESVK